jgi:hypothetical protein
MVLHLVARSVKRALAPCVHVGFLYEKRWNANNQDQAYRKNTFPRHRCVMHSWRLHGRHRSSFDRYLSHTAGGAVKKCIAWTRNWSSSAVHFQLVFVSFYKFTRSSINRGTLSGYSMLLWEYMVVKWFRKVSFPCFVRSLFSKCFPFDNICIIRWRIDAKFCQ